MVLKGKMKLEHKNQYNINLEQFDKDYFSGDYQTKSLGKCIDYNLILGKNFSGNIESLKSNTDFSITSLVDGNKNINFLGFYILENTKLLVKKQSNTYLEIDLSKNDFIFFNNIEKIIKEDVSFYFLQSNIQNTTVSILNVVYQNN